MQVLMRAARENARIKQSEMAKLMDKSVNTIIDWEKGRKSPRYDELEAYCRICGCEVSDIRFD